MSDVKNIIKDINKLLPNSTKGHVQIVHGGFVSARDYSDFKIQLEWEQPRMIAIFGLAGPRPKTKGEEKKRGTIATFHGGQHHYESDDDKYGQSNYPGRVHTSRSWTTKNETAEADAQLYVLVRNNLEELIRLAEIGLKVEGAMAK
jgi:hypothetical protein